MTTRDIKSTTEPYLLYEQRIKALAEPEMISILRNANAILRNDPELEKYHVISRGGDALNYYFPISEFVPTHDWDLGIARIPTEDLDQRRYNQLLNFIIYLGEEIARRLTIHFNNNIVQNQFIIKRFTFQNLNSRLFVIIFDYEERNIDNSIIRIRQNSICDLYIYGNVKDGVTYNTVVNGVTQYIPVNNVPSFQPKYTHDIINRLKAIYSTREEFINRLQEELRYVRLTLFPNTFNYIIEDKITKMKYIAPGDLLTDTMRMIYQSIYNIFIVEGNNKLDKYIIKYSKLLNVINKMYDLCPGNSCNEISAFVISRNTNDKDCNDRTILDKSSWDRVKINELLQYYTRKYLQRQDVRNLLSSKKICEILEILKEI